MTAPASGCCAPARANDQNVAIQFLDHVLSKLPFQVEQVQTDNGKEFGRAFH